MKLPSLIQSFSVSRKFKGQTIEATIRPAVITRCQSCCQGCAGMAPGMRALCEAICEKEDPGGYCRC